MRAFPKLKTGAVMQFPAQRTVQYSTQVCRFLDGTEQRYREFKSPIHRWMVQLDLLDEDEISRLWEFFAAAAGRSGSFEFEDPSDGTVYADCSLENDELDVEHVEELRGRTVLIVRENRK